MSGGKNYLVSKLRHSDKIEVSPLARDVLSTLLQREIPQFRSDEVPFFTSPIVTPLVDFDFRQQKGRSICTVDETSDSVEAYLKLFDSYDISSMTWVVLETVLETEIPEKPAELAKFFATPEVRKLMTYEADRPNGIIRIYPSENGLEIAKRLGSASGELIEFDDDYSSEGVDQDAKTKEIIYIGNIDHLVDGGQTAEEHESIKNRRRPTRRLPAVKLKKEERED